MPLDRAPGADRTPSRLSEPASASPGRGGTSSASTLSRVARLTLDDITRAEQQTLLRLGEPEPSVPEPLAELFFRWIESRDTMNTATNHTCRWLFPDRRAGQPLHPDLLAALLNALGIPTTADRTAAIRQHVLEMPAPVVAEALSYHRVTTAKLASEAGGTWSRYASGDHRRSPPGCPPPPENWRQSNTWARRWTGAGVGWLSAVVGDLSVICRWLPGHWPWLAPAINGTGHRHRIVPTTGTALPARPTGCPPSGPRSGRKPP